MSEGNIKRKALSGSIWKFMERFLAKGISLVVSIILARILSPDDYSVVSIVLIFFTFSDILISGGFNTALIQKKDADELDYSSVLILSLAISCFIYSLLFAFSPLLAKIYSKPILIPIFRVMGLILPITAIKSIVCAYISSNLQFKKFFFATIGGTVLSAFVGVILAYKGFGAWALVTQQMSNTLVDTVLLIIMTRFRIKLRFSFERVKSLFGYGSKIFASSFLNVTYSQLNPLIIGLKYSPTDLAFNTKGKSFPSFVSSILTSTFSAVLFPVMSKFQDDRQKLLRYTRQFIRISSYLLFPVMLGFFAVSDNFISLLLTDKWVPASVYLKIYCLSGMFDMIHQGNCETIKAMGRSDIYLRMEAIKKSGYFLTIVLFVFISKSPVQLVYSELVCTAIAIIVNSIPNIKLIDYKIQYQINDILPNLLLSIIMCVIVTAIGKISLPLFPLLLLQIVSGILVYLLLTLITKNSNLKNIIGLIKTSYTK